MHIYCHMLSAVQWEFMILDRHRMTHLPSLTITFALKNSAAKAMTSSGCSLRTSRARLSRMYSKPGGTLKQLGAYETDIMKFQVIIKRLQS